MDADLLPEPPGRLFVRHCYPMNLSNCNVEWQ